MFPRPTRSRGRLVFTTADGCRLQMLDLADLELESHDLRAGCALWVSPSGAEAVVGRRSEETDGGAEIRLARLGDHPEVLRRLGVVEGEVTWSADGARVAWCGEDGTTTSFEVATGRTHRVPGCSPRFAGSGALVTIADHPGERRIFLDGRPLLRERDLARGFDRPPSGVIHPLGVDQRPTGSWPWSWR